MMKKLIILLQITTAGIAFGQTRTFTVTYDNIPACNTTFTVENSKGKEVGSGKSDMSGTFSCNCSLKDGEDFTLVAEPDKGKKWTLGVPYETVEHFGLSYRIEIEKIEEIVSGGFDQQKEINKDVENMNADMNRQTGETGTGVKEIGMVNGILKTAEVVGEGQFKIIKASIGRSCMGSLDNKENTNEVKSETTSETPAKEEKVEKKEANTEAVNSNSQVAEVKPVEEEKKSHKEEKAEKEANEELEKKKEEEAKQLEKERIEAERAEQKRIEEEEEAEAENLNFTAEEFGQMSVLDLNKKKAWCQTAIGRNNLKLTTRRAIMKDDEIKKTEARIVELENAVKSIDAELARREEIKNAKKSEKEEQKGN